MRNNLAFSSAAIVVGVVLGYGAAEWQHRRELAAADDLVERYRILAAAASPFASELATLPNAELQTRAREAAARLERLKRAFVTTTEAARRELIAGEVSGNAFDGIQSRAEQQAVDAFTPDLQAEALALRDELLRRLTPEQRIELTPPLINLRNPVVSGMYRILLIEMLVTDLNDAAGVLGK
jgi:hypothetical protein